jgi:hypothetical protein
VTVENFTLPEGAASFRITAAIYQTAGTADFTDFKLQHNNGKDFAIPNHDFSSNKPSPRPPPMVVPDDAAWSYSFNVNNEYNYLHFIGLELDAELVQFDTPESLRYLTSKGTARSAFAMPYTATSSKGSAYWQICNIDKLEQSFVFSDENIPFEGALKITTFAIPFGNIVENWMAPLAKGAHAIRGHYIFQIMDKDKIVASATAAAADAQAAPEASFFGDGLTHNKQPHRAGLFTLADLSEFKVEIVDFRSSGQPEGEFAFRIELTDAAGDKFVVNRIQDLMITGDDEKLACAMQFDRYDIPSGWFTGKFGKKLPEKITVEADLRAALREGIKPVKVTAEFSAAATEKSLPVIQKTHCILPGEGRIVVLVDTMLPRDAQTGPATAKKIIGQIAKGNYTEVAMFVMGNRAISCADVGNPYMKRIHDWDPVRVVREETRKNNLKFSGMVCLIPEGVAKLVGFLAKHPEYAMRNTAGELVGWLDPAVPEVREYRIKDIVAIVRKYEIDGIQLDYARVPKGPSDRGAEIYQKEFGKDPRAFAYGSEDYQHWFQWQGEQLTRLVRELRAELKKVNPSIELSAYVQGSRYSEVGSWLENHQPIKDWLKEGLLDYIAPTGYVYDMLRYKCWSKRQIDYCRRYNPNVPVYITIGVRSTGGKIKDLEELIDQINEAQRLGADGVEFFHWHVLSKFNDALVKERYNAPAGAPEKQ